MKFMARRLRKDGVYVYIWAVPNMCGSYDLLSATEAEMEAYCKSGKGGPRLRCYEVPVPTNHLFKKHLQEVSRYKEGYEIIPLEDELVTAAKDLGRLALDLAMPWRLFRKPPAGSQAPGGRRP